LLVTALLGIAGYIVQNKASIAANATQHELVREAAEQHLVEDKAAKQLERVQLQNAEFVYPVGALSNQFMQAFVRAAITCGLDGVVAMWAFEFVSPPTQPYVTILKNGNPDVFKAIAANPMFGLPPEDLARLAADPATRARWVELATHTMIPPLRALVLVIQTQARAVVPHGNDCRSLTRLCAADASRRAREPGRAQQPSAWPRVRLGRGHNLHGGCPLPHGGLCHGVGGGGRSLGGGRPRAAPALGAGLDLGAECGPEPAEAEGRQERAQAVRSIACLSARATCSVGSLSWALAC
jgi:hypothetical protein